MENFDKSPVIHQIRQSFPSLNFVYSSYVANNSIWLYMIILPRLRFLEANSSKIDIPHKSCN